MEVSEVKRRLKQAIDTGRERSQGRRLRNTAAEAAYLTFLQDVATPVTRQLANALKVEGHGFTVFTPAGGLRLTAERGRDDFIEFALDTSGDRPQVVARVSYTRGSRTEEHERPLRPGAELTSITESDVLDFLIATLEPWLER